MSSPSLSNDGGYVAVNIEVVLYDELLSIRKAANRYSVTGPHGSVRKQLANFRAVYRIDHRFPRVGAVFDPSSGMGQRKDIFYFVSFPRWRSVWLLSRLLKHPSWQRVVQLSSSMT